MLASAMPDPECRLGRGDDEIAHDDGGDHDEGGGCGERGEQGARRGSDGGRDDERERPSDQ
jgi:hypothetical protein